MHRPTALLALSASLTLPGGSAAGQGLPTASPEAVGLSPAGLARIDSAMAAYVTSGRLPGIVVAVARDGRLAHWKAFGLRSVEANDPMERDDLFRIYSMTKPITSVAVMMLVEEGRLALEDPVAKHLPAFGEVKVWSRNGPVAPRRPMTVRDLLRHSSGLTYGIFGETPVDSAYRRADLDRQSSDLADLVSRLTRLPLIGHPGEVWNYGYSTDVLGRIVEVVSGLALDRFFEQRIFRPLGMKDSFFQVPPEKRARLTGYYARSAGRFVLSDSPDTGSFTRPPKVLSGGGGLVSTAPDYLRFLQMIANQGELDGVRVLKPATVRAMLRNQLAGELVPIRVGQPIPGTGFGLGFAVVVDPGEPPADSPGRAWWGGYANTFFFLDPHHRLAAMVFTQFFPFAAYPLEADFRRLVYEAVK